MKVLVVGLNPSKLDGKSPSLKTLNRWLTDLNVMSYSFMNIYQDYQINEKTSQADLIRAYSKSYDKIIALGRTVAVHLDHMEIDHFVMPHPSGLNRLLNDKKFVDLKLQACKNYLEGSCSSLKKHN